MCTVLFLCLLDLMLLACNWSTMGDSFFVCHHLAALYAYGYVLVRLIVTMDTRLSEFQ